MVGCCTADTGSRASAAVACHVCDGWLLAATSGRPGHGAGTDAVRDKSQSQKKQRQCSLSPDPRRHHQPVPATSEYMHGYVVVRKDRNRHGGGVCLYVNCNIAFNPRIDLKDEVTR